jgi:hypothetical protein
VAIRVKESKLHWNYFLALESDVVRVARFIEFREDNFATYSIELARLLMTAAAEVDVVAKLVCKKLKPDSPRRSIGHYASIILPAEPKLADLTILISRFGLTLTPWISWTLETPPLWWTANNEVKHHRDIGFHQANLVNALNAVSGLFSLILFYYALDRQRLFTLPDGTVKRTQSALSSDRGRESLRNSLQPEPQLFRLRSWLGDIAETLGGDVI